MIDSIYTILARCLKSASEGLDINELVDDWSREIVLNNRYEFDRGIVGLGWIVAFLIDNDYISGNIDEILEDVDDNVYKFTIKTTLDQKIDVNCLLSLATFYHQRVGNKRSSNDFYRWFTHGECLKLILDRLNTFLLTDSLTKNNISLNVDVILKYSYMVKSIFTESLIEEAFYYAIEKLLDYFETTRKEVRASKDDILNILKLLVSAKQYDHPYWIERLNRIYHDSGIYEMTIVKPTAIILIWDRIQSTFPEPISLYIDKKTFWKSPEGERLLFVLYSNLHNFKISYTL